MSTDTGTNSAGVAISIVADDDDPHAFCRRLAALVNPGPMHLARAFQLATQVYPVRSDTISGTAVVMRCEFRMRRTSASVDQHALDDVRRRLRHLTTFDERLIGHVDTLVGATQFPHVA
jgi:hypothetical protein